MAVSCAGTTTNNNNNGGNTNNNNNGGSSGLLLGINLNPTPYTLKPESWTSSQVRKKPEG